MCEYLRARASIARVGGILVVFLLVISTSVGASAATPIVADAIRDILVQARAPDIDISALNIGELRKFYISRQFEPVWTGSASAEDQSRDALSAMERADEDGLEPSDYHVGNAIVRMPPATAVQAAEREILLTDGILRYSRDLRIGRPALRFLDSDVELPTETFDAARALDAALRTDAISDFLAGLAPRDPQYSRLKLALGFYKRIVASGGWQTLPEMPIRMFDKETSTTLLLHDRLSAEGWLSPEQNSGLLDAVKRFQAHHGLKADGVVGPETRDALNVPASERSWEIIANMERARWFPRTIESARVVVNVPAGELDVMDGETEVLSSRVIVGKPHSPTPILRAMATSVTINPFWNVPTDIARKEIFHKLRRNSRYLQNENMILLDGPPQDPYGLRIDWRAARTFPFHIRQLPGPKNALGQIKLELPNRFDVYLHDTPAKTAFDLDNRFLSHGCVRVQQILPLASYALSGDPDAMISQLEDAIASGLTQHFSLKAPLPVYLAYWTAFVDNDGSIEFRRDIYGRDQRLIARLEGQKAGPSYTYAVGCSKA